MTTIATIIGARPQFIKAAIVSRALRLHASEILIHTGQHHDYEMSEIFFKELEIPEPNYNLGVSGGSQGSQTGAMLTALEKTLVAIKPDLVLVYGDTNSTLAGALAASKLHIPVAHVEAGLRSFNRQMPEEINRILTDHISEILFAPTELAATNLHREGITDDKIHLVGDVMYDAALYYGAKAENTSSILDSLQLTDTPYCLATIHRAENTNDPKRLAAIVTTLQNLVKELQVIWTIHPRTKKALAEFGISLKATGLKIIEPIGYLDMIMLEKNASVITTDSGGVQKEAYFYRVPCTTMRNETEWQELIDTNWNRLIPVTEPRASFQAIKNAIGTKGKKSNLYGNGHAAETIVNLLKESI